LTACAGIQTGRHYPAKNHANLTPDQENVIVERILRTAQDFRAQSQVNSKLQSGDLLDSIVFQE
jgi:hypothetical protein